MLARSLPFRSVLALLLAFLPFPTFAAAAPALRYLALPLPGAPSAVVSADVDGDGRQDLVLALAVTRWDQVSIEESAKMDDVEGLVEVLTVIPALLERRELRVYLGRSGGYAPEPLVLPLDASILSLEAGPPGEPVIALTDAGLAALRLQSGSLSWETLFEERSVLSATGTFVPNLGLVHDLDGDGRADVLFPTPEGASVHLSGPQGLSRQPASRIRFPLDDLQPEGGSSLSRLYPLPEVRDLTGDKLPDIVLRDPQRGLRGLRVLRNLGGGRFGDAVAPLPPLPRAPKPPSAAPRGDNQPEPPAVVWFDDLDGDGRAEYVTQQMKELPEDAGFRQGLKAAKEPHFQIRLHRARPDLSMEPASYRQFEVTGYAFDDDAGKDDDDDLGFRLPGGLQDLNGDGRPDLVTITLDFSLFQALKIVAVQRLSIDLDFHIWCQKADGTFLAVRGLDLSGNLTLNLRDLRPGQLSQFAGDFDGDGRSDLLIIEPQEQKADERGVTPPVRLDLYLSGGER